MVLDAIYPLVSLQPNLDPLTLASNKIKLIVFMGDYQTGHRLHSHRVAPMTSLGNPQGKPLQSGIPGLLNYIQVNEVKVTI